MACRVLCRCGDRSRAPGRGRTIAVTSTHTMAVMPAEVGIMVQANSRLVSRCHPTVDEPAEAEAARFPHEAGARCLSTLELHSEEVLQNPSMTTFNSRTYDDCTVSG
mmetsp:Transcript_22354/g.51220  ORF Transcript_22354/g.51220 Transcript_22354/m.51220 type:complete len:107 (-) Transcript_22354:127-447(-)